MTRKTINASRRRAPKTDSSCPDVGLRIERHRTLFGLILLSLLLESLIFAPISVWPLAFVCLVPWLIVVGASRSAPRVYFHSFVFGLLFALINMRWLRHATFPGYLALSVYLAAYLPLIACPLRHMVRRRRWPLALTLPIIWTGSEMARAVFLSGFPWFFLSHSQYRFLSFIQISDVFGAYGVSFVVAAVNGALADMVFAYGRRRRENRPWMRVLRDTRVSVSFAACLFVASIVYGQVQLHRETISQGPKIAVLQGDFLIRVTKDEIDDNEKRRIYFAMLDKAKAEHADLYLLPETPWITYLNAEARKYWVRSREDFKRFRNFCVRNHAYLVTGSASMIETPYELLAQQRRYNSAMVFRPDGGEPGRYDKIHLVYFGEIVPFRFGRLRPIYLWLNSLMPFTGPEGQQEYSLFRGESFRVFTMQPASLPGRTVRFGIPICYEDVMPYVSRAFVSGGGNVKRADVLLNISNDGWFGREAQQAQHLAISVFRAIENRVGVARAVNTGMSAFIEPDGRIHDEVHGDPANGWPANSGYAVARLGVDSRYSIYSRYGDWFAWGCAAVWGILFFDYWIIRVREQVHG